mmetsp:Transcript_48917/g.121384  ORF Transcript_48917/g.121384 Transcript_48917/m.121384 type:complete len:222 (+) Transcript_48917:1409-2074(+)
MCHRGPDRCHCTPATLSSSELRWHRLADSPTLPSAFRYLGLHSLLLGLDPRISGRRVPAPTLPQAQAPVQMPQRLHVRQRLRLPETPQWRWWSEAEGHCTASRSHTEPRSQRQRRRGPPCLTVQGTQYRLAEPAAPLQTVRMLAAQSGGTPHRSVACGTGGACCAPPSPVAFAGGKRSACVAPRSSLGESTHVKVEGRHSVRRSRGDIRAMMQWRMRRGEV